MPKSSMWQEPSIGKAWMPKSSMLEDQRIGISCLLPPVSSPKKKRVDLVDLGHLTPKIQRSAPCPFVSGVSPDLHRNGE
jgi:hypothetical protein